jgi:hypothetical protein
VTRNLAVALAGGVAVLSAAVPSMFAAASEAPGLGTTTTTTAATTTTPGGPTTTSPPADFALPAGFKYLVDDTNRITVAIPAAWSNTSTSPADVDGSTVPTISAATDLTVFAESFDAPGVRYGAYPFTAEPQTLLDRYGYPSDCDGESVVPYADGVFTGLWGQWTDCGATGQSARHVIVASPADHAFTAVVGVQLTGAQDQQALDVVLETFNVTPTATWPVAGPTSSTSTTSASTAPASSLAVPSTTLVASPTTVAVPSTVPASSAPASSSTAPGSTAPAPTLPAPTSTGLPAIGVRVVDNTNFLTVTVPADWDDQSGASGRRDDGGDRPTITAAPDIAQFLRSFEGSGVRVQALPATTDPGALLQRFAYPRSCADAGITPFDDGRFTGHRQAWLNCDGSTTRVVNVAARPIDGSFTIFVQIQQTTPDDAVLNQVLGSFGSVAGAVYPSSPAAAPIVPTGPVPPELLFAPTIEMTTVVDDDGRLSFSVPSTWSDTETRPQMNDDTSDRPRVAAAPVLDEFYVEWDAAGVQVVAYPYTGDPSTLLRNLSFDDRCSDGGVQSFDNGTLTGLMQTWTACGGTVSRNVVLSVSPTDQSLTLYVEIQLPDNDNTPLQAVLSTLQVG